MADDPLGVKALITSKMTLAEFGRSMGSTGQTVNHWIARGIPGSRVFRAADVLEMKPEDMRRYTAEALKPPADVEREYKAFSATFRQLEPEQQATIIQRLQRILKH
jgi:hypothetical protein